MLKNITRSQKRFIRTCTSVVTISLFLTLIIYNSLEKIISYSQYHFMRCKEYTSNLLLHSGFTIDEVIITGNKFSDIEKISNLINRSEPILFLSLSKLKNNIQSTSKWIKDVRIYRILPNVLSIDIDEYKPFAKYDHKSVIDHTGKVIIDDYSIDNLISILGQNSLLHLNFVRDVVESQTQLSKQITSFIFIENRRWNVILKNGMIIKLPENNPYSAWNYITTLQGTTDFMLNDWRIIDMRIADKIFVKR